MDKAILMSSSKFVGGEQSLAIYVNYYFLHFKWSCFDPSMFFQEPSIVLLPCIVSQRRFTSGSENNITSFSIPFHWHLSQRLWRQYHELKFYRYCLHIIVAKQLNYVFMVMHNMSESIINTLRPRQNGRHLPDDIFKCMFSNDNIWISIKFSLKSVTKGPINNIPALVQIMAWRWPGDKPLSEPRLVSLRTHICVTRPQWVNV